MSVIVTLATLLDRNNRNILECKYNNWDFPFCCFHEIIETYWNVNVGTSFVSPGSITEIIETYWNVNCIAKTFWTMEQYEIIETYWNVNHCKLWLEGNCCLK